MRELTIEDFSGAVGEDYELQAGDGALALRLEEAQPLPKSIRAGGSFSLTFLGPRDPILPQAIYTLRRGGEALDIFICPIGRDDSGTRYEAVFN